MGGSSGTKTITQSGMQVQLFNSPDPASLVWIRSTTVGTGIQCCAPSNKESLLRDGPIRSEKDMTQNSNTHNCAQGPTLELYGERPRR
jgi:hypothetical protein